MASGPDFKLSATLRGHEEDVRKAALFEILVVRAIVFPNQQTLFSASRDNSIRRWNLTTREPPTYDDTIALQGSHWFNSVALSPKSSSSHDPLIAAGGRETFVFVKKVGSPVEEDPHRLLIAHAGNITCLAFSKDGSKIISGGWDSQVFVWDVEAGNVVAQLEGHQGPVWGIMVYDEKFVFTACADKMIRIFDINGKSLKTINGHTDVVRCFCKLPAGHSSGAAFASAGNDEVIRLWTLEGTPMGKLEGHTAYIYSLACLPNGDIVSSSEDRTVKIWRDGQSIQTITHPAISLWAVAACPETGDIASGASDNVIRIFTRDPARQADAEIGTVVSGEGSGATKKVYEGKEYDYVFDIDIEDGKPPLKLPYNLTESAWDAARKFLERNELPLSYYEQVANWIAENTKGARLGSAPSSQPPDQRRDAWGSDKRYRPGDASIDQRKLPQRDYVHILEGNAMNAVNKLSETLKQLQDTGKLPANADLTTEESSELQSLVDQLNKNPSDPHPTSTQISALLKAVKQMPNKSRVPAVALLARIAVSPAFIRTTSAGDKTVVDTLAATGLLSQRQETPNNTVHALRLLTNLFTSEPGRLIADGVFDSVLTHARPFATDPESPAQFRALASLYLNYSVLLTAKAPSTESSSREARAQVLLIDIATMLESESPYAADADAWYRALLALGTLLSLGSSFRAEMKGGVSGTLHVASTKAAAQAQNVKEVIQEIRDELR
nr:phospholipase a-2-activating protein [Quercus suber]